MEKSAIFFTHSFFLDNWPLNGHGVKKLVFQKIFMKFTTTFTPLAHVPHFAQNLYQKLLHSKQF